MNYITIISLAVVVMGLTTAADRAQSDFVAHEWGTFTCVQGGDGKLLRWSPLQTSELPPFVHRGITLKVDLLTLQRMETPVIYFYTGKNLDVDVDVDFPKGTFTEWYPQTTQTAGGLPMVNGHSIWKNLKLIASTNGNPELDAQPPLSSYGSRYFAAREPDSAFVQMEMAGATNTVTETEKFIFYRGAGSFQTPLRVGVDTGNHVTVQNNGHEKIARLFLVSIHGNQGAFASMDGLPPDKTFAWQSLDTNAMHPLPLGQFQGKICSEMKTALVREGLFPQEAQAMVDTWRDSWFAEQGDRVLYLLPRAWTDETLPLTIKPAPSKLVRVMVGRAEILAPNAEEHLHDSLVKALDGGNDVRAAAARELKSFGRFAETALDLTGLANTSTNMQDLSYELLYGSQYSKFE
ncbi:MAG TPA: hypothetical protein VK742_07525 [Candidatus Sulfotelmatobacter sp.]|nr:hypothetical protein [Candidatus Sulfotelmatobacter sp.]